MSLATPNANTPVVGEIDNYAEAGAVVNVCGDFSAGLTNAFIQVGNTQVPVQVINVTTVSCQLIMPFGLTWSIWPLYLVNANGASRLFLLNKPVAWWVGPDKYITRGDTISIFGECLTQYSGEGKTALTDYARVVIQQGTNAAIPCTVVSAEPGRVQFIIPPGATNGTWSVRLHNGHGYQQGNIDVAWTKPIEITVGNAWVWDGPVIDVDSYFVQGDVSDQPKIVRATNYAKNQTRPTLKFNSPVYNCHIAFQLIDNCRYLGNGRDITKIQCKSDNWAGNWLIDTYFAGNKNWAIEELEIFANGKIVGDINLLFLRTSENFKINNCRINAKGTQPIDLHHSKYGKITNSDVIGKILYLGDSDSVFVENNNHYGTNDTLTLVRAFGGSRLCVAGNTWQHLDANQPQTDEFYGIGRCFVNDGTGGSARRYYIANNAAINYDPRPTTGDLNQGEKILAEANQDMEHAQVVSSTATITNLPLTSPKSISPVAAIVKITKGKGFGQVREIKTFTEGSNGSIEVTEPWAVIPDNTSVFSVGHSTHQWYNYKNDIEGNGWTVPHPSHVASEGISAFGGCSKWINHHNIIKKCRYGIRIWNTSHNQASEGSYPGNDSSFGITNIHNTVTGCRWALGLVSQNPTNTGSVYTGITNLNMIRIIRDIYQDTLLEEIVRLGGWDKADAIRNISFNSIKQQKRDISLLYPLLGVNGMVCTGTSGLGV